MKPLWITLASIGGFLLFVFLLLLFGRAKIRIRCRSELCVILTVLGIRKTLYSSVDQEKPDPNLSPRAMRRREERRKRKAERAAEKARKRAAKAALRKKEKAERAAESGKPTLNLNEKLSVITTTVKRAYDESHGHIRIRAYSMHIRVGSADAAKTAILYGVILQTTAYLAQWIESHFNHIVRKPGDMTVEPDFTSGHTTAEIDMTFSLTLWRALLIGLGTLRARSAAQEDAEGKAQKRLASQKEKPPKKPKPPKDPKKKKLKLPPPDTLKEIASVVIDEFKK